MLAQGKIFFFLFKARRSTSKVCLLWKKIFVFLAKVCLPSRVLGLAGLERNFKCQSLRSLNHPVTMMSQSYPQSSLAPRWPSGQVIRAGLPELK